MSLLRILHVDTGRTWRGGQAQVELLVAGLAAEGATQLVAAPTGPMATRLAARGLPVVRFAPRSDVDVAAAWSLVGVARGFRPDIVHLHDARAHALGWIAARAAGAACVVSRRVAFGATTRLPHAFKYRHLPVQRFLALSGPVRDELVALGVPAGRIDLVPDGVDVGAVERAVARARADGRGAARRALTAAGPGRLVVGTIAAFTREKGQDILLAAAARAASGPGVILHGSGPEEAHLRLQAGTGVAFVAGEDVFTTLAAVDALVVPSRAEGLGSIVLAAHAAGVPVIAAAIGGLPEIVLQERTGLLVPADDAPALAAALDRLRDQPEAAQAWAQAAREAVRAYDVPRIVERTRASYAAALAAAGRGPR